MIRCDLCGQEMHSALIIPHLGIAHNLDEQQMHAADIIDLATDDNVQ